MGELKCSDHQRKKERETERETKREQNVNDVK